MLVETTQIVYGPGRFIPAGTVYNAPPFEAHQLVNDGKARFVESGALERPVEHAMLPVQPQPRPRPQRTKS